eukprot:m.328540 g.328540  ORF g.328540 m.328540 type:complete len:596 (+) comp20431_c0_seq1:299-2086(+)
MARRDPPFSVVMTGKVPRAASPPLQIPPIPTFPGLGKPSLSVLGKDQHHYSFPDEVESLSTVQRLHEVLCAHQSDVAELFNGFRHSRASKNLLTFVPPPLEILSDDTKCATSPISVNDKLQIVLDSALAILSRTSHGMSSIMQHYEDTLSKQYDIIVEQGAQLQHTTDALTSTRARIQEMKQSSEAKKKTLYAWHASDLHAGKAANLQLCKLQREYKDLQALHEATILGMSLTEKNKSNRQVLYSANPVRASPTAPDVAPNNGVCDDDKQLPDMGFRAPAINTDSDDATDHLIDNEHTVSIDHGSTERIDAEECPEAVPIDCMKAFIKDTTSNQLGLDEECGSDDSGAKENFSEFEATLPPGPNTTVTSVRTSTLHEPTSPLVCCTEQRIEVPTPSAPPTTDNAAGGPTLEQYGAIARERQQAVPALRLGCLLAQYIVRERFARVVEDPEGKDLDDDDDVGIRRRNKFKRPTPEVLLERLTALGNAQVARWQQRMVRLDTIARDLQRYVDLAAAVSPPSAPTPMVKHPPRRPPHTLSPVHLTPAQRKRALQQARSISNMRSWTPGESVVERQTSPKSPDHYQKLLGHPSSRRVVR